MRKLIRLPHNINHPAFPMRWSNSFWISPLLLGLAPRSIERTLRIPGIANKSLNESAVKILTNRAVQLRKLPRR